MDYVDVTAAAMAPSGPPFELLCGDQVSQRRLPRVRLDRRRRPAVLRHSRVQEVAGQGRSSARCQSGSTRCEQSVSLAAGRTHWRRPRGGLASSSV
jgi:hypothetical protein